MKHIGNKKSCKSYYGPRFLQLKSEKEAENYSSEKPFGCRKDGLVFRKTYQKFKNKHFLVFLRKEPSDDNLL